MYSISAGIQRNQDRVEVMFVDYGNKDFIEKTNIRKLDSSLITAPVMGYLCSLDGLSSPDNFWSPENVAKFEDFVLEKEFKMQVRETFQNATFWRKMLV